RRAAAANRVGRRARPSDDRRSLAADSVQPGRVSESELAERSHRRLAGAAAGHPAGGFAVAGGATTGGRALGRDAAAGYRSAAGVTSSDAERLATLLREAGPRGTVVFTGAGVSTESGIPDFRSPGGIWSRYAPIQYHEYLHDPQKRRAAWQRGL